MSFVIIFHFVVFYAVLCSFITICMKNPNYAIFVDESMSTDIRHSLTMGSSLDILELLTIHSPVNIFCRNDPFHSLQTQKQPGRISCRAALLSSIIPIFIWSNPDSPGACSVVPPDPQW